MTKIFLNLLNMSITGSFIVLAVMLLRVLLKKAPRKYSYALWSILGIRLLCPFSFSSILSVFNIFKPETQGSKMTFVTAGEKQSVLDIPLSQITPVSPSVSGNAADTAVSSAVSQSGDIWTAVLFALSVIWAIGIAAFIIYFVFSCISVKKRVSDAVLLYDNVYESKSISSAFVFGFFSPKIYLPSGLDSTDCSYITAHEKAHIRRFDHIVKLVALTALCLHWFNPLMWLAYRLMVLDMELSCDELAISSFDKDIRKGYANALLNMSARQNGISLGGILAFGENSTKERINGALSAKKPAVIVSVTAVIVIAIAAVGLLTNGNGNDSDSKPDNNVINNNVINNISNSENDSKFDELTDSSTDIEDNSSIADVSADDSSTADEQFCELTEANAEEFVESALSSLIIYDNQTAEFTLPDIIPTDPEGRTKLTITMNAIYVEGVGSYGSKRFLDYETNWNGGETFTADLSYDSGKLQELMLRVAFMTEIDENILTTYYSDYVTLEEPFNYNESSKLTESKAELSMLNRELSVLYTTKNDQSLTLSMNLPDGITAAVSDADNGFSDLPAVEFHKDGQSIGSMYLIGYGATDDETLATLNTTSEELPMMIYSPVALSNMIDYHNGYRVVSSTNTSSNAVCYPLEWKTNYHNDCVLAYDLSSERYFAMLSFAPDILTEDELLALSTSVAFS